jgi:hypothetical protein
MESVREIVKKIVNAAFKMHRPGIRLRIHPPKRRTALQRLKARLYYRRNKVKRLSQRRRYLRQHKSILKRRKLFQRFKPSWYKKPKHFHLKTPKAPKPHKFKVVVPKKRRKV